MGFGVASKWTGAYAGAGLGVIFFIDLYRRYREYKFAKSDIDVELLMEFHTDLLLKNSRDIHLIHLQNMSDILCFCAGNYLYTFIFTI